jgi:hypothetical protein
VFKCEPQGEGVGSAMCVITDHSLLRYIERVWHVDIEAARAEMMLSGKTVDAAALMGCDTVKLGNGARLKLKSATVVTVLPKRGH